MIEKVSYLISKKLMELATSSKMQIFMTMFMFWMMGNGMSIFTIFFIFQSLFSAVTALLKTGKGKIFHQINSIRAL
jgi:hypothetical protein